MIASGTHEGQGYLEMTGYKPAPNIVKLPPEAIISQATALIATVRGAMTGAFAVWLGHEK